MSVHGGEADSLRPSARCPDSGVIDCSHMNGVQSYDPHFAMVADGRLEYVNEVIDGIQQVRFFRITDRGRVWLAEVTQ